MMNLRKQLLSNIIFFNLFFKVLLIHFVIIKLSEANNNRNYQLNGCIAYRDDPRLKPRKIPPSKPLREYKTEKPGPVQLLQNVFKASQPPAPVKYNAPKRKKVPRFIPGYIEPDYTSLLYQGIPTPRFNSLYPHLQNMRNQQSYIFEGRPASETILPKPQNKEKSKHKNNSSSASSSASREDDSRQHSDENSEEDDDLEFEPYQVLASTRHKDRIKYMESKKPSKVRMKTKKTDTVYTEQGYKNYENDEGTGIQDKKVKKKTVRSRFRRSLNSEASGIIDYDFKVNPLVMNYTEPLISLKINVNESDFENHPDNKTKVLGGLENHINRFKKEIFKQNNLEKQFFDTYIHNGKLYLPNEKKRISQHEYFEKLLNGRITSTSDDSSEENNENDEESDETF